MDYKLELIIVPVTDVDGAKAFYSERTDVRLHPERGQYETFASFSDPDGNPWMLQEIRR
jgi:hypothetical protein